MVPAGEAWGTGGSGSGRSGEAVAALCPGSRGETVTGSEWKGFLEAEALDMGLQVLVAGWWGLCGGGRVSPPLGREEVGENGLKQFRGRENIRYECFCESRGEWRLGT